MARRIVQALSLLLLNASFIIPAQKWLCLPVLNCHSCPVGVTACPIGVFGHYTAWRTVPVLAIGLVALFGVLLGRFLCGWICPFGLLQDFAHRLPTPKFEIPGGLKYVKYGVLLSLVIAVPLIWGVESKAFFCWSCPIGTLESAIPRWIMDGSLPSLQSAALRLGMLAGVLVLIVGHERGFCKVICPLGAILAGFGRLSFMSIRRDPETCIDCGACDRACPMDLNPSDKTHTTPADTSEECIVCTECTKRCPADRTLGWGLFGAMWNSRRKHVTPPEGT